MFGGGGLGKKMAGSMKQFRNKAKPGGSVAGGAFKKKMEGMQGLNAMDRIKAIMRQQDGGGLFGMPGQRQGQGEGPFSGLAGKIGGGMDLERGQGPFSGLAGKIGGAFGFGQGQGQGQGMFQGPLGGMMSKAFPKMAAHMQQGGDPTGVGGGDPTGVQAQGRGPLGRLINERGESSVSIGGQQMPEQDFAQWYGSRPQGHFTNMNPNDSGLSPMDSAGHQIWSGEVNDPITNAMYKRRPGRVW